MRLEDKEMADKDLNILTDETLVKMAQEGSATAEEFLITKYKALAKNKSKTYFIAGADNEDVIQEGMIGIYKAIRDYDEDMEASFHTFASLCINRQIITAIKKANRFKYQILNESMSLNQQADSENGNCTIFDKIPSGNSTEPETLMVMKEIVDYLKSCEKDLFSPLENRVWLEMTQGKNYREIAENLNKNPKAIDNAIQRVKKKILGYLEC